jgi:ribulose-5-phosphate 4-epimerase/fuculose-1-phosphate aldolase
MLLAVSTEEVDHLRRQCFLGARFMWRELRELYGHVSVRLPDGKGFLLMMVRVPEPPIDPDDLMAFDYEGNQIGGASPTPYEIYLHTEIFRTRPDVQSIVHSHPHVATALTAAGKTIFGITQQSKAFGAGIPVFKGDFIEDRALGVELAQALGDQPAAMMKGHGCVVVGKHVPDAVSNVIYLEQAAKQQLWAATVGTPEMLPDRIMQHRFPEQRSHLNQGNTNLWRQLVWEWEQEQAREHGHSQAHGHEH